MTSAHDFPRQATYIRNMVAPSSPLARTLTRAQYAARQTARVGWYMSHYLLARRLSAPIDRPGDPPFRPKAKPGSPARMRNAFLDLFAQDLANVEAGLYPQVEGPSLPSLTQAFDQSRRFFEDLPQVERRRLARDGVEVRKDAPERGSYPAYFLQNFHYQSGGWLTRESAQLYDTQVEVLFGGAADAMRRIALGELARALKGRDQRKVRLADIACGTGRFLSQILTAFPRMPAVGLDLSPAYVEEARARVADWPQAEVVAGPAEATPFADASLDAATCVYLFHELPPRVRRDVAREIARIVKPGGVFVLADSLQTGDFEDLDQLLEYFPVGFHEPFYSSYIAEDLPALFAEQGFILEETKLAFLTKVLRFRRK